MERAQHRASSHEAEMSLRAQESASFKHQMVVATNWENRGGRIGSSAWDSENEMSSFGKCQTSSGDSGITNTSGGADGALHGQLTQQPLGKYGHEGHSGQVGRIESSFAFVYFGVVFPRTPPEQRPQHFLQLCVGSFGVSVEHEQQERLETNPMARAFAGPLRIRRIPRHDRMNRASKRACTIAILRCRCHLNFLSYQKQWMQSEFGQICSARHLRSFERS
jgi:hypothetical protein